MNKHLLALTMIIPFSLGSAQAAPILLVAAGGGGGAGFDAAGINGQITDSGSSGTGSGGGGGGTMGGGGGGGTANSFNGAGGAGLLGAGGTSPFSSHATGGMTGPSYSGGSGDANGGYGGGGGGDVFGGGGGGGYSGGGGGSGTSYATPNGGGGGGGGSLLGSPLAPIVGLSVAPGSNSLLSGGANGFVVVSLISATNSAQRFGYTDGPQDYTFNTTGLYSIVAAGGQGGNGDFLTGGLGAEIGGTATFTAGSTLELIVGGGGVGSYGYSAGGGGGGSFVFETYAAPAPVVATVPEPSTLALLGTGVVGLLAARRKRDAA